MADLIPSISIDSLFEEIAGTYETIDSNLFSPSEWKPEHSQELSKSFDMAMGDFDQNREEDRMESPDSGINFDFDIEGCSALLSGNDPILNNAQASSPIPDSGDQDKSIYHEDSSVINSTELFLPVVTSLNRNTSDDNDSIHYMDTSDEENNDQENVSNNSVKIDTNKIHSYSIMNINKPRTMKTRRPIKSKTKKLTLKSQGQKISVSVRNDRKKQKLYEMESLNDPVAERNRLNAINAKKNRDRKKQQLQEAEEEIEKLREENEELKLETDNYKDQLEDAMRELKNLKQLFKTQVGSLPPHLDDAEE